MMTSDIELESQFNALGITVEPNVLKKCVELCNINSLSEQDFVESWIAFSLTHLDGAMPTIETISQMEKKELNKPKLSTPTRQTRHKSNTPISVYNSGSRRETQTSLLEIDTTPKRKSGFHDDGNSPRSNVSQPVSFSPNISTPSSKYTSRDNSGKSTSTFGVAKYNWESVKDVSLDIHPHIQSKDGEKWKYFFETVNHMSIILNDINQDIAENILTRNNLPEPSGFYVNSSDISTFVGCVCCDGSKFSLDSVMIQGIGSQNEKVMVNMSELSEFALFPGQIIVFQGKISGKKIIASKIYTSAMLPLPEETPNIQTQLQIYIAAGPFTQIDTLSYQPLNDLVETVKKNQPNILILIGPLIDASHSFTGDIAERFEDYYMTLLSDISISLESTKTKVFYVASSRDAFNIPVFPTRKVMINPGPNITLLSDPTLLNINGLVMGITATDTLFHLGKREVSNGGNRLGRLASHLLHQQNFYPLYPPDIDIGIDLELWSQHSRLPLTPHLLITPSDLHNFIKDVSGCIVINPEHLSKGLVGGTYACIEVQPHQENEKWTPSTHIAAKIVKI